MTSQREDLDNPYEVIHKLFREASESDPLFFLQLQGSKYFVSKDFERAIVCFSEAIKIDPDDPNNFFNRGSCFYHLNELKNSIVDFSRCIEISEKTKHSQLHIHYRARGDAFSHMNEDKKALEDYSRSIEINPRICDSYFQRSLQHERNGRIQESVDDLRRVLELNPSYYLAYCQLGLIYTRIGDYDKSIQYYSKSIEIEEMFYGAYSSRASAYFKKGSFQEAITDYSRSISINPHHGDSFYGRGLVYLCSGEREKAKCDFEKVMCLNPRDSQACLFHESIVSGKPTEEIISNHILCLDKIVTGEKVLVYDEALEPTIINNAPQRTLKLKEEMKSKRYADMTFKEKLGTGVTARTYLCEIDGFEGRLFAAKIFKEKSEKKIKELLKKDGLFLIYNPNIVHILGIIENEVIDITNLPDSDLDVWSEKNVRTSLIIMPYYPENLEMYVKRVGSQLDPVKMCYILQGIISGAKFLFDHMIVHRDLHPGNILVDDESERFVICDFGCAIDLRHNTSSSKFLVERGDEVMYSLYSWENSEKSRRWRKGGALSFLPPEITLVSNDDDDGTNKFIDYSKCDLYSVGMIGKFMMENFSHVRKCDQNYDHLQSISQFLERFLEKDVEKRIDYGEAVLGIRNLISKLKGMELKNISSVSKDIISKRDSRAYNESVSNVDNSSTWVPYVASWMIVVGVGYLVWKKFR